MMKKLVFIVFLIANSISAQIQYDSINLRLSYKKVEEVDFKQSDLKNKIEKWFAVTFKDSKEVIRLANDENIIGSGYFDIEVTSGKYLINSKYFATIDIALKDGRYKLEIYDLVGKNPLDGSDIPLFYVENLNFENYKEVTRKTISYLNNPQIEKKSLELIEKGKIKQKDLDKSNALSKQLYEDVNTNFELIATSLKTFLNKESGKDDW